MTADAFAEGHDLVAATVLVRGPGDDEWATAPMQPLGNDRFEGTFVAGPRGPLDVHHPRPGSIASARGGAT